MEMLGYNGASFNEMRMSVMSTLDGYREFHADSAENLSMCSLQTGQSSCTRQVMR